MLNARSNTTGQLVSASYVLSNPKEEYVCPECGNLVFWVSRSGVSDYIAHSKLVGITSVSCSLQQTHGKGQKYYTSQAAKGLSSPRKVSLTHLYRRFHRELSDMLRNWVLLPLPANAQMQIDIDTASSFYFNIYWPQRERYDKNPISRKQENLLYRKFRIRSANLKIRKYSELRASFVVYMMHIVYWRWFLDPKEMLKFQHFLSVTPAGSLA